LCWLALALASSPRSLLNSSNITPRSPHMVATLTLDPQHDHLIPLPPHWTYLDQFKPSSWAPHPSQDRCVAAAAVMTAEVAYPNAFNPEQAEHLFYEKYAG